ncbi:MAG: ABC transporter substrate-binding protein [Treponema sp.]|nr:ABC transporter substrate-binding protein [Treponema sp.]
MRRYIISLLLLAAALLLTALSASSCSQRERGPRTAELRYGLSTEPVTLDPLNPANTADGRSILFNVFEGLVKPDSSGTLIPALAESYRIEEDGSLYVFNLRPGVFFHDGSPLRRQDVIFSLSTARRVGFPGFDRVASIDIVGVMEAPEAQEIQVRLRQPDPEFLPYLTVGIVPEDNLARERNPIGTGPFMIESYAPQQSLVLTRNPNYWQAGIPALDRVTIVFVSNTDTLITGLLGGNIQGAGLPGGHVSQLNPNNFDIFPWYSNMVQLMALNNAEPPLDDIRVRQAINYALDINEIIDIAFFGFGQPSGSPVIPGLVNVYDESLRDPYPHNIERARELLAEAGYEDGFSLEITVAHVFTMHVDTAQVIVNQLSEAGIDASIVLVDWATWLSDVYQAREYQATIISLDANTVSPRSFLYRYLSDSDGNFINFNSPDFDQVYNEALLETDEETRIELYKEAQRIISDNAASVFIQDILGFRALAAGRFGGVINYPLYVIDFAAMYRK